MRDSTAVDCGQWLATAGYPVFLPHPPGGSRHGHEFVVYPREGHGLVARAHRLDALRRVRAWCDRRLQE